MWPINGGGYGYGGRPNYGNRNYPIINTDEGGIIGGIAKVSNVFTLGNIGISQATQAIGGVAQMIGIGKGAGNIANGAYQGTREGSNAMEGNANNAEIYNIQTKSALDAAREQYGNGSGNAPKSRKEQHKEDDLYLDRQHNAVELQQLKEKLAKDEDGHDKKLERKIEKLEDKIADQNKDLGLNLGGKMYDVIDNSRAAQQANAQQSTGGHALTKEESNNAIKTFVGALKAANAASASGDTAGEAKALASAYAALDSTRDANGRMQIPSRIMLGIPARNGQEEFFNLEEADRKESSASFIRTTSGLLQQVGQGKAVHDNVLNDVTAQIEKQKQGVQQQTVVQPPVQPTTAQPVVQPTQSEPAVNNTGAVTSLNLPSPDGAQAVYKLTQKDASDHKQALPKLSQNQVEALQAAIGAAPDKNWGKQTQALFEKTARAGGYTGNIADFDVNDAANQAMLLSGINKLKGVQPVVKAQSKEDVALEHTYNIQTGRIPPDAVAVTPRVIGDSVERHNLLVTASTMLGFGAGLSDQQIINKVGEQSQDLNTRLGTKFNNDQQIDANEVIALKQAFVEKGKVAHGPLATFANAEQKEKIKNFDLADGKLDALLAKEGFVQLNGVLTDGKSVKVGDQSPPAGGGVSNTKGAAIGN